MHIPAWLSLGVAVLVLGFGLFRVWLGLRKERPDDPEDLRPRPRGMYAMRKRTNLLIGIVYCLLGGGLIATVYGWNPFGNAIGPGTTETTKETAPTKTQLPIDQSLRSPPTRSEAPGPRRAGRVHREYRAPPTPDPDPCGPAVLATPSGPAPTTTVPRVDPDGTAMFVYVGTGDEKDVRVIGDFLPEELLRRRVGDPAGQAMTRGENNVWFARLRFHDDARLDYQISVDGKAMPDPLNLRTIESGIGGPSSELVMPGARIATPRDDVPHGTTSVVDEPWAKPKITVDVPPGYDAHHRYPVVYTADGTAWRDLV